MSVPLVLVAASGLAREVLAALAEDPAGHEVRGVLDDAPNLQGTLVGGVPVLGTLEDAAAHPDAQLLVCVGRGAGRATVVDRLAGLGVTDERYATYVHPLASVPATCRVGSGSVVLAGAVLTTDVRLGRHVVVMPRVVLTHDDSVADFATLCSGVVLGGHVHVGRAAYLGMNSSVREDSTVGAGAVLGMGAVLLTDLPDDQTWVGVPARPRTTSSVRTTTSIGSTS
ncbi:sugar O-acyltransferase, sialic acid O-acetyltransferase NeuD family [Microlunatus sagamiharensis]|uniref:Sugar O-acyltransferase, sialic acid O-acetyltransferase NeuD family n=1 Tax=Microlunatus sagamiharensis TaxID=546874 RepID=A0A1H2LTK5_9ACTN|nr:NeuD/PglB/VioB family sugar acetyltransferase [Microlunatus sagamiharensis]SDU84350.1 sugar O-acyltransferase, sialic acid O-acetyltransferase NeuD family [Microlunatus sagamiharensis]